MAKELISIPDLGSGDEVDVIELCVKPGDSVVIDQSLIVLESAKASMEVPSTVAGRIISLSVKVGDKVLSGTVIAEIETDAPSKKVAEPTAEISTPLIQPTAGAQITTDAQPTADTQITAQVTLSHTTAQTTVAVATSTAAATTSHALYAGPAVRKLARELGIELQDVKASGPRQRITQEDVRRYVKHLVQKSASTGIAATTGNGIPAIPSIDFAKFGGIELLPMTRIDKLTRDNMHRAWLNIPHVTQLDEADVSDIDSFRSDMKAEMDKRKIKLTPIAFLIKACANALREHPKFNRSLHADGDHFVQKHYVHIGMAVDTPMGLMVPVIRDVDKKGLWEIAHDVTVLADKAKNGKLSLGDISGGCFTISSLGAIGGQGFTPIVNAPEVAILGVSKTQIKPIWDGQQFVPKKMMPLTLSYDHRVINGADAGRFFTFLIEEIADIRRLTL